MTIKFPKDEPQFAFNIWDFNSAQAAMDAAAACNRSIILQTSVGVYKQIPQKQLREFVTSYAKDKKIEVWLNIDHCKDIELIINAVEKGWDIVMLDASDKSIEENIKLTNRVASYAHEKGVLVEAEVGKIRDVETEEDVASKVEIDRFIAETDVDFIAAAIGNAHGMYKGTPKLHYDLIEYIAERTTKPFVVHGGSGLEDKVLRRLLHMKNVKKINISTDMKMAYRKGIQEAYEAGKFEEKGFQAAVVGQYIHNTVMQAAIQKLQLLDEI